MRKNYLLLSIFLISDLIAMDQPVQRQQVGEMSFAQLLEKAKTNDGDAQYAVGDCYQFGRNGAERSLKLAEAYFHYAMMQRNVYAAQRKGSIMLSNKNFDEAYKCFLIAALGNEHLAMYELAKMNQTNGWGTQKSLDEEIKWLNQMITEVHPTKILNDPEYMNTVIVLQSKAACRLAETCRAQEPDSPASKERAIALYEKALVFNPANADAKEKLARLRPSVEASSLLMTSSESEAHAATQCLLGKEAYDQRRYAIAVDCFRKVQDNKESQYYLALCLEKGYGLAKDEGNALAYFRASAEQGYKPAIEKLRERESHPGVQCVFGKLYRLGIGVQADSQLALSYYENSHAGNCKEAMGELVEFAKTNSEAGYMLGLFHETGNGCVVDMRMAASWYERAAIVNNGHALGALQRLAEKNEIATFALAHVFEAAQEPLRSYDSCRHLLACAADGGSGEAAFKLAMIHLNGTHGEVNNREGIEWCIRAAELKWQPAIQFIIEQARKNNGPAQYAMGILCQKGLAPSGEALSAVDWFKKAAEQRYGPAYLRLAEIVENKPLKSFQLVGDFTRCYGEVAEYYEGATICGIQEGTENRKRIREITDGIEFLIRMREQKGLGILHFNNLLFMKLRDSFPEEASPEICFWTAHICSVVSQFANPLIQDAVCCCLRNIANFGRKDRLALVLLKRLSEMVLSPDFLNNPLQVSCESFRLAGLINVALGTAALQNAVTIPWSKETFKRSSVALQDVLINLLNNKFFGDKEGSEEEYRQACSALLTQFSSLEKGMKKELLWDEESQKLANVLSLRTLLGYSRSNRFKNRVIWLHKYSVERFGTDGAMKLLASWARMGLHRDEMADRETENFIRNYATDAEGLRIEELGLEIRIAICLAEARRKAIEGLVPESEQKRELQIWYLEKKAGSLLALIGDDQPLNDRFMRHIDQVYSDMSAQKIADHVLTHYDEVAALLEETKKTRNSRITHHSVRAYFEQSMTPENVQKLIGLLFKSDDKNSRYERYELTERGAKLLLYYFGYLE